MHSLRITPLLAFVFLSLFFSGLSVSAPVGDDNEVREANYELAAKFTSKRISKMTYDFRVMPRWIKNTDKFWYSFETAQGRSFWLAHPNAGTKEPLFDNAKMAANLTRMTKDPYDHQHLPITRLKFVRDGAAFQFKVTSTQEEVIEIEENDDTEEEDEKTDTDDGEKKEEEKEKKDQDEDEKKTEDDDQDEEKKSKAKGKKKARKKKVFWFEYDISTQTLTEIEDPKYPRRHPSWASVSPDGKHIVFARDHNLFLLTEEEFKRYQDAEEEKEEKNAGKPKKEDDDEKEMELEEVQLTEDGEEHYSYMRGGRGQTDDERAKKKGKRQPPGFVLWSQDSKKFATIRGDNREVGDLWVVNSTAEPRPTLESYKYPMPGEENVGTTELHVFDISSKAQKIIEADRFKDQSLSVERARMFRYQDDENPPPSQWLSEGSDRLYFGRISRDLKRYDVCMADLESGDVTVLIEERLNTYVETQPLERLRSTGELIHWSERDGWGHYYLYDQEGNLKRQITSGPFSCRGIVHVDEERRILYFNANGREDGEDPYFNHLYRIHLDGSGLRLLNEGDYDHQSSMCESGRYFVDNYSRVDAIPESALFDCHGKRILTLEQADFSLLDEVGFRFPKRFKVKADDGVTDLYGVMHTPYDLDPTKKYPIIAYVYPGPQTEAVPKSFTTAASNNALAQLGFVVIAVGNRGGHPARSKWYHNYGYGNLRDYGLADKKVAIERLANRHGFIDIDRVGIFGHSGGGFMSTAAMLVYPDFFKVAVSSAGNHDNNVYNRWWSEKHHGVKEVVDDEGKVTFEYEIDKNSDLAKNLKGRLLLTTGDIDNNVHPAGTLRMAKRLIQANKRFDFFVFPGQRHGFGDMSDYWFWLRADYFVEHLLGDHDRPVDMIELNREKALKR